MDWVELAMAVYAASEKKKASQQSASGSSGGMGGGGDARAVENVFDNSGWNVSFGSSKIDSNAMKTTDLKGGTADGALPSLGQPAGLGGIDQTTALYLGGALLLVMILKKKKAA